MVAYGSKERPVDLGPFSRIVGVHWGPKYLALGIAIAANVQRGNPLENFSIIGPDLVEPVSFHYAKQIDISAAALGSAYIGGSGRWTLIPSGSVEVTGLPPSSTIDLGSWLWVGEDGAGTRTPFYQWHAASASAGIPDVDGPGGAGKFNQGLDPSIDYKGQAFLAGAPNWTPFFTNAGQWGTGATDGNPLVPLIGDIQNQPFSLAGLTATYKEKIWHPIASRVSGVTGTAPGSLFVLLKKEDVTA